MLKEIVNFSKELESHGIYDIIQENQRKIDKPIMVIPVSDDLTEIQVDDAYFVFKDYEKIEINSQTELNLFLDTSDQKLKKIETNNFENYPFKIKKLNELGEKWQNIFLRIKQYIEKPTSDSKGNKSIGGNSGTNSYNILIFEAKQNILKEIDTLRKKIKRTYDKTENIGKGVLEEDKNIINQYINLLKRFAQDDSIECIYHKIESLNKITQKYDKKKEEEKNSFESIYVIIKLPKKIIEEQNIYKKWYEKYLAKKIFKTEENKYPVGTCSICNKQNTEIWIPDAFHNLDQNKVFIKHLNRLNAHNIAICKSCSFETYRFQEFFLNKLKIKAFPLFINKRYRNESVNFMKKNKNKLSFRNIISDIYKKTNQNELDFYLVIYDRNNNFLTFDYITGFYFYKNNLSVFKLEELLSKNYFTASNNFEKLTYNYFNSSVDTGNKDLDQLIYRYRSQVFDYIYRAKYNSLSQQNILDIHISSLNIKLINFYNPDMSETNILNNIRKANKKFLLLDEYFGGYFMKKLDEIKTSTKINSPESFAYYAGQIVYFLLMMSEKKDKKHSMVEPFVNIPNFGAFGLKLDELFNAYSHAIRIDHRKFNDIFSRLWEFLYENKDKKFTKDLKMLFYSGYFDDKNIFFEKSNKSIGKE